MKVKLNMEEVLNDKIVYLSKSYYEFILKNKNKILDCKKVFSIKFTEYVKNYEVCDKDNFKYYFRKNELIFLDEIKINKLLEKYL